MVAAAYSQVSDRRSDRLARDPAAVGVGAGLHRPAPDSAVGGVRFAGAPTTVAMLAEPTSTQHEAFELIGAPIPLTLK